jgi:hypothetical protein
VNVDPLPISQEINKEEKEHDRVAGDYASEKKISLLTTPADIQASAICN